MDSSVSQTVSSAGRQETFHNNWSITPYASPYGISRSTYVDPTLYKEGKGFQTVEAVGKLGPDSTGGVAGARFQTGDSWEPDSKLG